MIGEILGGHLKRLGACGLICDGAIRDVAELAKWNDFSVFSRAITPRGPISAERGRVNCSVVVGGRLVNPGDLIIGDDDGLASLDPKSIVKLSPRRKESSPRKPMAIQPRRKPHGGRNLPAWNTERGER